MKNKHKEEFSKMTSSGISKIITKLASNVGYEEGILTGHCMRKGFATQFVINNMTTQTTENIRQSLCDWVGWDPNSKVVSRYVNDTINWNRDMTKEIHDPETAEPYKFNINDHPILLPTLPGKKAL